MTEPLTEHAAERERIASEVEALWRSVVPGPNGRRVVRKAAVLAIIRGEDVVARKLSLAAQPAPLDEERLHHAVWVAFQDDPFVDNSDVNGLTAAIARAYREDSDD